MSIKSRYLNFVTKDTAMEQLKKARVKINEEKQSQYKIYAFELTQRNEHQIKQSKQRERPR
jgi:hypothetical protein